LGAGDMEAVEAHVHDEAPGVGSRSLVYIMGMSRLTARGPWFWIPVWVVLLWGLCMFSLCQRGFPPGSLEMPLRLIGL